MNLELSPTPRELGVKAAELVASRIKTAISESGGANIILATGASQFTMLENLVLHRDIDWSRVTMYHLDEYIDLAEEHPASFRRYLKDRFVSKVGRLKDVHLINGSAPDPVAECRRLNGLLRDITPDVACVGIGENSHLAFNDPPADFSVEDPFIIVELDEDCRRQQLGEGWFKSLEEVPTRAISMSVRYIMKCKCVVVSVPDQRKAKAVRNTVEGPVTPQVPASILQQHACCTLFLDAQSASLLKNRPPGG